MVRSEPAADSTVSAAPTTISLWFSSPVQIRVTTIHVASAAGHAVAIGAPHQDAPVHSPVVANLTGLVGPGKFTVTWRTMALDGHVVSGHFAFTVAPAASH